MVFEDLFGLRDQTEYLLDFATNRGITDSELIKQLLNIKCNPRDRPYLKLQG